MALKALISQNIFGALPPEIAPGISTRLQAAIMIASQSISPLQNSLSFNKTGIRLSAWINSCQEI